MKDAIIAVCSTVIGTVVGWILGKINFGRLHIALSDFSEEFHYTDPLSIYIPGKKDHELYSVKLSFKVRLYNSSSISTYDVYSWNLRVNQDKVCLFQILSVF